MKSPWLAMFVLIGFVMLGMFAAQSDFANSTTANAQAGSMSIDDQIKWQKWQLEAKRQERQAEEDSRNAIHASEVVGEAMALGVAVLTIAFAAGILAISAAVCRRILRGPAYPPQRRRQLDRQSEYRHPAHSWMDHSDEYDEMDERAEQQESQNVRVSHRQRQVLGPDEHLP